MRLWKGAAFLIVAASLGCGGGNPNPTFQYASDEIGGGGRAAKEPGAPPEARQPAPARKDKDGAPKADGDEDKPTPRKIIYSGNAEVIVEDFEESQERLDALVAEHGGYLADWGTTGTPGSPRSGTWTVRVPAEKFKAFLDGVTGLGELQSNHADSEDITDRYYDLEARIATDEKEREALLGLLQKTSETNLTDILAVRKHLNEVQARLDQEKGQHKRWRQLVALATVRVTLRERTAYVPDVTPAFGTRISRTFSGSIDALVTFGKGLVLAAVALAPWLGVLAALGLPFFVAWRVRKGRTPQPVEAPAESPPPLPDPAEGPTDIREGGEG